MEEIVQALFEQGALVGNGAVRLITPVGEIRIPSTVQGILAARIDRLPPAEKDLLQTLAVKPAVPVRAGARRTRGRRNKPHNPAIAAD